MIEPSKSEGDVGGGGEIGFRDLVSIFTLLIFAIRSLVLNSMLPSVGNASPDVDWLVTSAEDAEGVSELTSKELLGGLAG